MRKGLGHDLIPGTSCCQATTKTTDSVPSLDKSSVPEKKILSKMNKKHHFKMLIWLNYIEYKLYLTITVVFLYALVSVIRAAAERLD